MMHADLSEMLCYSVLVLKCLFLKVFGLGLECIHVQKLF